MRQCVLPFKDISKIAIYRYYKNFTNQEFVIVSSDEGNAAVIDLQNLSVILILSYQIKFNEFIVMTLLTGCQILG